MSRGTVDLAYETLNRHVAALQLSDGIHMAAYFLVLVYQAACHLHEAINAYNAICIAEVSPQAAAAPTSPQAAATPTSLQAGFDLAQFALITPRCCLYAGSPASVLPQEVSAV